MSVSVCARQSQRGSLWLLLLASLLFASLALASASPSVSPASLALADADGDSDSVFAQLVDSLSVGADEENRAEAESEADEADLAALLEAPTKAAKKAKSAAKPKSTKAKKATAPAKASKTGKKTAKKAPKAKAKAAAPAKAKQTKAAKKSKKATPASKATKTKAAASNKKTNTKTAKAKTAKTAKKSTKAAATKATKATKAAAAKKPELVEASVKGEDDDDVEDFPTFTAKYNRKYKSPAVESKRRAAYEANMSAVKQKRKAKAGKAKANTKKVDPEGPAVYGATPFSDLTPAEFRARFLGAASAAKVSTAVKAKGKARAAKLSPAVVSNMRKAIVRNGSSNKGKAGTVANAKAKSKAKAKAKARFAQRSLEPAHDAAALLIESAAAGPPVKKPTPPPPPPPKDASVYAGSLGGQHGEEWTAKIILTAAEIAALRAQAKQVAKPKVRPSGKFVDALVNYSDITPVVRFTQGCAACWAAVTADLLQATYYRRTGKATSQLSAQGIVDCVVSTYDWGCGGGSVMTAINSIVDTAVASKQSAGFLYRESDYPWRYNTAPEAKPVCRAKGLVTFPVVSAWSWATFPAVSPIIDVSGMQAAFNQAAKDFAKMQSMPGVQAEIAALQAKGVVFQETAKAAVDQIAAKVKAAQDESDRSVAAIDAETKRIEKVKDDAFKALTAARAVTGPTRDQQVRAADDAHTVANNAHSARLKSFSALKDAVFAKRDSALAALDTQREAVWARMKEQTDAIADQIRAKSESMNGSMKDMQQLMDSFAGNSQRSYMYPGSAAYTELATQADGREVALARVLNAFGPLAIIIDASGMQNYKGGIYDGSGCSNAPTAGNHAALLVGLGADKQGKQYWIIKNSWGTQWGNSGYLHLSRGGNLCGLTNGVTLANAAGDLNDPVSVLQDHAIKEFLAGRPSTYVARV